MSLNWHFCMAVGSADAAEMTLVQRVPRMLPPLHNCECRRSGCEGVSRRKCKGRINRRDAENAKIKAERFNTKTPRHNDPKIRSV
jgi:hypothetical protein